MKKIITLIVVVSASTTFAQEQPQNMSLTLDQVINLASGNSLDAFRYKNMYLASYWEYRYYQADRLPSFSLNSTPIDFNRYRNKEYNFNTNEEEYVLREYYDADATASLSQKFTLTGGTFYLRSGLGMVKNLNGDKSTSYQSTPVSIGYSQQLNGYNELRWKSRIEPLKYEKAKKEFIQSREMLAMTSTSKFFNLVDAQIQLKIAENNLANADTLYKIGTGRFQVGTVTQDELLNLQLGLLNARQAFNRAQLAVQRYQSDLNSFLAIGKNSITECIVPSRIPDIQVDAAEALDLAIKNNPDILGQEQQLLEQDQSVARAKSEAGLNTSIFAQYGLNQSSDTFSEVYDNPDKSQRLQLGITIPILDWGRRKGQLLMAESNREVVNARIKQERIDFEQNIVQSVMEFNLQSEQVRNAAIADTVAQKGYEVTFQRFLIGKVDVLKLNQARNDRESARKSYISAVNSYWTYFYRLRLLTLYDFINRKPLLEEYDQLLENSSSWK